MATQTTSGITFTGVKVETSPNGSAWTDIGGYVAAVTPEGGERSAEERFTAVGDSPIIGVGKKSGYRLRVSIVYTRGNSDPFGVVWAAKEANTTLYVRWSPQGATTGDDLFTSSAGKVIICTPPGGEVESAGIVMAEFTLACATLTKSTV